MMKIRASNDVRTLFRLVYFLTFSNKDNFSKTKFLRIVRVFPSIITNWSAQFNSQNFSKIYFFKKPIFLVNFLDTIVTFRANFVIRKASYHVPVPTSPISFSELWTLTRLTAPLHFAKFIWECTSGFRNWSAQFYSQNFAIEPICS